MQQITVIFVKGRHDKIKESVEGYNRIHTEVVWYKNINTATMLHKTCVSMIALQHV